MKIKALLIILGITELISALVGFHTNNFSNIYTFIITIIGAVLIFIGENSK